MSSNDDTSRNRSCFVFCKCGLKARFAIAKSNSNWGRLYYGCPNYKQEDACSFFRWVAGEEELYSEISGLANALELSKLRSQKLVLEEKMEDGRGETTSLMDENKVLKRIALVEGLGDHGLVVNGELTFKRKDLVVAELHKARSSLKACKLLLFSTWLRFAAYWAFGRM